MKLKKLATIMLSCCLAAAAFGSITANAEYHYVDTANGYDGYWDFYWESRYIGISQARWSSSARGQLLVWSSYMNAKNGSTYYGQGGYGFKATSWIPSNIKPAYGNARTTFYKISRNGVRSYFGDYWG